MSKRKPPDNKPSSSKQLKLNQFFGKHIGNRTAHLMDESDELKLEVFLACELKYVSGSEYFPGTTNASSSSITESQENESIGFGSSTSGTMSPSNAIQLATTTITTTFSTHPSCSSAKTTVTAVTNREFFPHFFIYIFRNIFFSLFLS